MDGPGFSLCAVPLELSGPVLWSDMVRTAEEDRGPEYSRLERDGENLVSKRGQDVMVVTPSQLRYTCNSSNVPGPHIILRVKFLTSFTSRLPFLLCFLFVLTLLIRKGRLVVLLFCSIVLHSQTYLRSKTPDSLLCSIPGYWAFYAP